MERTLTRKQFLKVAGAGAAGTSLLGTSLITSGCGRPPSKETNVVVVILDSLRKDHVGAYGNDWIETPNLDVLAKESLLFTRAYPESIPTICARRAIHTGLRTWPFRNWDPPKGENVILQGWQPMPEGQTALAEILKEHGYATMFVTDNLQQYKPSYNFQRGFDAFHFIRGQTSDAYKPPELAPSRKMNETLLRGPMTYLVRRYFANTVYRKTEEDWFSPQVFAKASEFLEIAKEAQPFFLVVDNYDPHEPWDPPEEYVSLYDEGYEGKEPYSVDYGSSSYLTDRQLKRVRALYSAEVTMTDRWLGNFLEKMEELNLFENTLLILISDHGVALGEHGVVGKLPSALWPELTDVPFFIRHPGGKSSGESSDYYASTHDVAPTILGFLGIEPPQPMEGQDLSVLFDGGEPEARPHFTLGYDAYVWTRDARYAMFILNNGRKAQLYDLRTDPGMGQDIAQDNPGIVKRMFEDYVLKDAGGPLPQYDLRSLRRAAH
jgi:arylsulfatase A-like enzyme